MSDRYAVYAGIAGESMIVNQRDEPIREERFGTWNMDELSHAELATVVAMLLDQLELKLIRTNATKHGYTEFQIQ